MVEPIILTEYGETLLGYPGSQADDDSEFFGCFGVHDICQGFVDAKIISKTHRAIVCRHCGLRVVIPSRIKTYGDLRAYMAKTLAQEGQVRFG